MRVPDHGQLRGACVGGQLHQLIDARAGRRWRQLLRFLFQRNCTIVTSYKVHPFVGMIEAGHAWTPQETEVAQVLELSLPDLVRGFESKRLLKKGVPIKTPTYTVDGHLVWGATARIVENLLDRLAPVL